MKKITTKLNFTFSEQDEMTDLNMDVKLNTYKKHKKIKIVEYKRKKKNIDASTKLF